MSKSILGIFDRVKQFFGGSTPAETSSTTHNQVQISVPVPNDQDTKIEIKVSKSHVLDGILNHENVQASMDLVMAVEQVRRRHWDFENSIHRIDDTHERILRTQEVDKLINQTLNALIKFAEIPHALAISQILPEYQKTRLEVMIEHCHKTAESILQFKDNVQSTNSVGFLNAIRAVSTDKDFLDLESDIHTYLAKIRVKPIADITGSPILSHVLCIGVNVRREVPDLLSDILSHDENQVLQNAIVANNQFEVATKNNKDLEAVTSATMLLPMLPTLQAMSDKIEAKIQKHKTYMSYVERDIQMLETFVEQIKVMGKLDIFEDQWHQILAIQQMLSTIRTKLITNLGLLEEMQLMVSNTNRNATAIRQVLKLHQ